MSVLPCKMLCQSLCLIIVLSCLFAIIFCNFNLFVFYAFTAKINKWYHSIWKKFVLMANMQTAKFGIGNFNGNISFEIWKVKMRDMLVQ